VWSPGAGFFRWMPVAVLIGLALLVWAPRAQAAHVETFPLPTDLVNPADEPGFKNPNRPSDLNVNVYLPDAYEQGTEKDFPVLLLLHGANGYHRTWAKDLQLEELAPGFPGIVVMPDGGVYGMYSDWYNRGAHGQPQWMSYHLNQVMGEIEKRYPIRPGRRWHAIAGVSMGGGGAMRYAAARPGYFGSAASFSAAPLNNQLPEAILAVNLSGGAIGEGATYEDIWGPTDGFYAKANNPQDLIPNLRDTRLMVQSGDGTLCPGDPLDTNPGDLLLEGFLRTHATAFAATAREQGIDVTEVRECGAHSYETTQRGLIAALKWGFFHEVPEDPQSWTYMTASRQGDAHGVRFEFASDPTEIIHFRRDGNTLRGEGSGTATLRIGNSCDLTLDLPFVTSIADCFKARTPGRKAALKLKRRGRVLLVRSNGPVVKGVTLKVTRKKTKGKRGSIARRKLGKIGPKAKRVKLKLAAGQRYRVVASGRSGKVTVRKAISFRMARSR
jgi:S-formylglutathione hydrolase FrmB